jgi:phosphoserine phosphatase RsbU/P
MNVARAKSNGLKSVHIFYLLLFLWALISVGYYTAGGIALREEFFHATSYARGPFGLGDDALTVNYMRPEAKEAGLANGDVIQTLNGKLYTGYFQRNTELRHSKPGDYSNVQVKTSGGRMKEVRIRLAPMEGPGFTFGGYVAFLTPVLGVPLLGLIVGIWVVAARPRDLNAWLVLMVLSFMETSFGNLDWSFWTGGLYVTFWLWNLFLQVMAFPALLWLGIYFPERWRVDRRWPWIKWLILAIAIYELAENVLISGVQNFAVQSIPSLAALNAWSDRIGSGIAVICQLIFLAAVFDKLRSASTPDARRRLRVLAIGSGLSLGPLIIMFTILPYFGINPGQDPMFEVVIPFVALFPLTLAYVVIVQRAMDVRILLRMGTKYLLARVTLIAIESGIAILLIIRVVLPMMQRRQHQLINGILLTLIVAALFRAFAVRDSLSSRLQRWLDRKFFREAYNSEVVLSELAEHARKFTDKKPLIETVAARISEVLHVPLITVWLRGSNVFHLQQALGVSLSDSIVLSDVLSDQSSTVQNLARTNQPATVYRDRPEEWFTNAGPEEKEILEQVHAELLLPLPGRERLLGLMALGPKKSEEPYTPTDLRVLQSLATQTGLALEISELAQSLAREAAQRERNEREMEIAREVQQRLFPQRIPEIAGLTLAGMCRAALGVGGDYYDVIELDDGRLGLAIGDVSGKGISAALLMASLRASLRGMTLDGPSNLAAMMQKVNRLVYEASADHRYATFFFATYDPNTRELRYVNAGHNPPMLIKAGKAEPQRLDAGGLVVGLLPQADYEEQSVALNSGDLFLAYTDGISEAMTVDDQEWGEEQMLKAVLGIQAASADEVLRGLFRAADEFTAGAPQHDDMTLLIMKLE